MTTNKYSSFTEFAIAVLGVVGMLAAFDEGPMLSITYVVLLLLIILTRIEPAPTAPAEADQDYDELIKRVDMALEVVKLEAFINTSNMSPEGYKAMNEFVAELRVRVIAKAI